jgi:hypothetical protein
VGESAYYAEPVAWASENGIVMGVGEGLFDPEAFVSRQDIAALLTRYADFAKAELPAKNAAVAFTDEDKIADYAGDAVRRLQQAGVVNGRPEGSFAPNDRANRAEVAAMVHRCVLLFDTEGLGAQS